MGGDPRGRQPAAIDVWAQRDIGFVDGTTLEYLRKKFGDAAVADLQIDKTVDGETQYEYGIDFYNDLVDYLNERNFDGGGWTAREVQAVGWVTMQKALGVQAEFVRDIIGKNTRRISIGLAPGGNSALEKKLSGREIPVDVAQREIGYIADLAGVNITQNVAGAGAYLQWIEGAIQIDAVASPEAVHDFMDMVGYAFQQTEVISTRPLKTGKKMAVDVLSPGLDSVDQATAFFSKFLEAVPKDKNNDPIAPGFQQIVEDGVPGIRLLNFGGKWRANQLDGMLDALNYAADAVGIELTDAAETTVDMVSTYNDWKDNRNGKAYIDSLKKRGRVREAAELQRRYPPSRVDVAGDGSISWRRTADGTAGTAGEQPTRVAFSRENLDAMAANTANSPDGLILGITPPVLQALGMQKRPIIITRRKVMKIVNPESVGKATTGYMAGNVDIAGRIPLSTQDLYDLPQMLADPVAVMRSSERSSTGGKGLVILTDKVVDGYPVVVTIADPTKIKVPIGGKVEDFPVEEITTAFPKNTAVNKGGARKPESPLNRDLAQNSIYFNAEKAQQLLPLLNVSIPRLRTGVDTKGVKTPAQIRQKYGDAAFSFEPIKQQPIPRILNERKDVRFSRQTPPTNRSGQPVITWKMQDRSSVEERWDNITFQLQDKFIDLKDVIIGIEDSVGGPVADPADAYLQEELFHGRAGKRVKDFALRELRPLLESMRADGITIDELDMYLHAKHAKEANAQVRSVNPNIPDGGSGMTNAEADAYLQGLDPAQRAKLQKHHQMVMNITSDTRQLMVDYGLETQDTIDTWEQAYQNYVPLFREGAESGSLGIGQGYSISGKQSKRRMGSTKSVTNILANIALQRERVISRGEKNRVALSLYQLAVQNPNQDFWLPLNPDTTNTVQAQSAMRQQLLDMGVDPNNATNIAGRPTDQVIDPKSGLVTLQATQNLAGLPNILMVRINGKDRALLFNSNDERAMRLIASLKNLTANQLGTVMSGMAAWTRYFASINTQYNPAFGLYNFVRDLGAGSINLSNTPLAGKQATVVGRAFPAVFGIYRDLRMERRGKTPRSGWAKWYEEFESEGGKTGFRDLFARADERRQKLDAELYRHDDMIPKRAFFSIINWLSDFNEAIENGIRLAAYKTAREQGLTKERAASLAKNLTVNFNRKGNVTPQMGAMYAFFNAATQGTARISQTFRQERGSRTGLVGMSGKGGLILGGLLGVGVAQAIALAMAGFEPDDIDDFIKDRSIIIPTGDGKYKAIPMPLGFNAIPSMSRRITEMFMREENDWTKETLSMLGMMADTFNPLGANTSLLQMVAPTTIDPLVDLATNRDFAGRPIAKPDFDGLDPTPGFTRGRQNASGFSTALAEMIDRASGGTGYTPGYFSPTPDQIDYIIGYMTGGIGREVIRTGKTVEAIANNEELATFNVPLVGRFFGDNKQKAVEVGKFYDYIKKLNGHKRNIDGMDRDGKDWESYLAKNPEAEMADYVDKTTREISELKKYREERKAEGASKAELKELNEEIFQIQYEFNLEYRAYRR